MVVEVRIPTVLRAHVQGKSSVNASGATVGEVFDDIVRQFPGLAAQLRNDDGTLHRFVNVFRNDEDVRYIGRLGTPVSEHDVISIMPAVAGGNR